MSELLSRSSGTSERTLTALPAFVAHADWGVNAKKRWVARARLGGDGRYRLEGPEPVLEGGSFEERMGIPSGHSGSAVIGFDFPIGVPRRYAQLAGIEEFPSAMLEFGDGRWQRFYDVAKTPGEIGLHRPFYPARAGARGEHTRRALMEALDLDARGMLRRCDGGHGQRRAANPLFWTLGGAQVGKAALSGWREMIIPAWRERPDEVALWPFDGSLHALMSTRRLVIAETYPAEFYAPLGLKLGRRNQNGRWGKRQQHDRRAQADGLSRAVMKIGASLPASLEAEIVDGFGSRSDGEDRFDAVVGLLGMLLIVLGHLPEGTPQDDDAVLSVEGWILGRPT